MGKQNTSYLTCFTIMSPELECRERISHRPGEQPWRERVVFRFLQQRLRSLAKIRHCDRGALFAACCHASAAAV